MAKFELKLLDVNNDGWINCELFDDELIKIGIKNHCNPLGTTDFVFLDKSTAIKLSKTLRTEINKIV